MCPPGYTCVLPCDGAQRRQVCCQLQLPVSLGHTITSREALSELTWLFLPLHPRVGTEHIQGPPGPEGEAEMGLEERGPIGSHPLPPTGTKQASCKFTLKGRMVTLYYKHRN